MKTTTFNGATEACGQNVRKLLNPAGAQLFFILGPCVVQSAQLLREIATELAAISQALRVPIIFKGSFDKANRTSGSSFRGIGVKPALEALAAVREEFGFPVLTDIHESSQVPLAAKYVDVLQIPAFLCRQTDLLLAAGQSGLPVNVKKGQFISAAAMAHSVAKVRSTGNNAVFLTERGNSFGYGDLVVDFRNLPVLRQIAPVVFDGTHSVQRPPVGGEVTGGSSELVPLLARAAAAAGIDGLFLETHPEPMKSPSDGANMVKLSELHALLQSVISIHEAAKTAPSNRSPAPEEFVPEIASVATV